MGRFMSDSEYADALIFSPFSFSGFCAVLSFPGFSRVFAHCGFFRVSGFSSPFRVSGNFRGLGFDVNFRIVGFFPIFTESGGEVGRETKPLSVMRFVSITPLSRFRSLPLRFHV
jgi:hypothetical protein